jgi:serine/threonine-protein kinase
MAPEQARAIWDEVDGRTDLWAVGATAFNLLTGALVHQARSINEHLLFAMTKEAPRLETVSPTTSPAVCHVVDRALAFDRDRRWPDAAHMQEALRQAYQGRSGKALAAAPRLFVPSSVPNRTLASTEVAVLMAPKLPTTGAPVETVRAGGTLAGARKGRRPAMGLSIAVVIGGGAAVVGVIAALSFSRSHAVPPPVSEVQSAAGPAVAASAQPTAVPHGTPSVPEVAATDLPTAAPPTPPASHARPPFPPRTTGPATVPSLSPDGPPSAVASTRPPACNPPYTIDPATGKKHFKLECL